MNGVSTQIIWFKQELPTMQRKVAESKSICLDRLFFHYFFPIELPAQINRNRLYLLTHWPSKLDWIFGLRKDILSSSLCFGGLQEVILGQDAGWLRFFYQLLYFWDNFATKWPQFRRRIQSIRPSPKMGINEHLHHKNVYKFPRWRLEATIA